MSRNAGEALTRGVPGWRSLTGSDTTRAAGMAAAQMATNVIALVFTVVFARVLGASGYGSHLPKHLARVPKGGSLARLGREVGVAGPGELDGGVLLGAGAVTKLPRSLRRPLRPRNR